MANSEDVLTRAKQLFESTYLYHFPDGADTLIEDLCEVVRELRERDAQRDAAEGELLARVEELRRDRARLDWVSVTSGRTFTWPVQDPTDGSWWIYGVENGEEWTGSTIREVIDAAMGAGG